MLTIGELLTDLKHAVEVRNDLVVGKLLRKTLREPHWKGVDQRVSGA